jgi:hypothetical protein
VFVGLFFGAIVSLIAVSSAGSGAPCDIVPTTSFDMFLLAIAAAFLLFQTDAPTPPGSALRPGMVLVYESNGEPQPSWTVLAVTADARVKEGAACAIVQIRRGSATSSPPEVRLCIEGGILLQWTTTLDASGRPIRRLRERYATSLTTAIDGEFEVADSGTPSGFRTTQSFVLREIR